VKQILDPSRPNAVDPETRALMAVLDTYPAQHWVNLYNNLVASAQESHALASTIMAHLSHAEVRAMLAFLVGSDAEVTR
jgi:hypothetical protein